MTKKEAINAAVIEADKTQWIEFKGKLGSVKVPQWLHLNGHHVDDYTRMSVETHKSQLAVIGKDSPFVARRHYYKLGLRWVEQYGQWDVKGFDLETLITEADRSKENAALMMWLGSLFEDYFTNFS